MSERSKNVAVRDEKFRERILWAIALSIALHEVVGGLWPQRHAQPAPEPTVVAERIKIEPPRPTPKPTAPPTPMPTPHVTPAPHYTLAPRVVVFAPAAKAAATPTHRLGGAAAHKRIVHVKPPVTPKPAPPESLAEGTEAASKTAVAGRAAARVRAPVASPEPARAAERREAETAAIRIRRRAGMST